MEAYKWANLAAAKDSKAALQLRITLAKGMTKKQVAEGQRRSAAFVRRGDPRPEGPQRFFAQPEFFGSPVYSGSGFFITEDGFLLTNAHVAEAAGRLVVVTSRGRHSARLAKADKLNDIAVLKVAGRFHPIPLAPSREAKLGEAVFTIGFPNPEIQGVEPKLTRGEISSLAGYRMTPGISRLAFLCSPGTPAVRWLTCRATWSASWWPACRNPLPWSGPA